MAAAAAGARENAAWGYKTGETSVVTLGGTTIGFPEGSVEVSVPRDYAYLKLDSDRVQIAAVCVSKELMVSCGMGEVLEANLQYALDNDAAAGSVLTIDDDMGSTVALLVNTYPPNEVGGNDTRVLSVPKALGIGDGPWSITKDDRQILPASFKAIANTSSLLATITDSYT